MVERSCLETQLAINKATYKQVANVFTSPGMTKEELLKHFTIDGVFICRVLLRYGIWQGMKWDEKLQTEVPKLTCIDNGLVSATMLPLKHTRNHNPPIRFPSRDSPGNVQIL